MKPDLHYSFTATSAECDLRRCVNEAIGSGAGLVEIQRGGYTILFATSKYMQRLTDAGAFGPDRIRSDGTYAAEETRWVRDTWGLAEHVRRHVATRDGLVPAGHACDTWAGLPAGVEAAERSSMRAAEIHSRLLQIEQQSEKPVRTTVVGYGSVGRSARGPL